MVPAARAAPRLEANTTPPKPASFRNSRRSIGWLTCSSLRKRRDYAMQYRRATKNIPAALGFMDAGIRPARGRYRYLARITLADRAHCRDPRNAIAIPASLSNDAPRPPPRIGLGAVRLH